MQAVVKAKFMGASEAHQDLIELSRVGAVFLLALSAFLPSKIYSEY